MSGSASGKLPTPKSTSSDFTMVRMRAETTSFKATPPRRLLTKTGNDARQYGGTDGRQRRNAHQTTVAGRQVTGIHNDSLKFPDQALHYRSQFLADLG